MPFVLHISDRSDIARFAPRMPPTANAAIVEPVVWAVDQAHLAHYLLPRDCPRVAFHVGPHSTPQDVERFFGASAARHVVAIEAAWFERALDCTLWAYAFDPASFECIDANAGYFVSKTAVVPVSCQRIDRPLVELANAGVELRVLPQLHALAEAVAASSLGFSCIRMRNAAFGPIA